MELGSVYARVGSKVTVVEFLDSLIPTMDGTMGKELQKSTKKLGMEFYLGHKVTSVENKGKEVIVKAEAKDGKTIELKGDYCLVSIGRRPYTDGLGLEKVGIETVKGQIAVDDHLKTKADNIYAIGDVVKGAMLAHKAEEEGVYVARNDGGTEATCELSSYSGSGVYLAGSGERRLHGGAIKDTRPGLQIRKFPYTRRWEERVLQETWTDW
jgi:dihydrolipoamide dehydrogenase